MHIKETKTKNKQTGKVYIKHTLVESVRTEKGPRHRTVMNLGRLDLPKELWGALIAELESRLSGQISFELPGVKIPAKVKKAADTAMDNYLIRTKRKEENRKDISSEEIKVNLNNLSISEHRSFGAEFIAHCTWNDLKLPSKLKELGFNARERSLAEATVAGRLINPASELSTWDWMKNFSCIGELTEKELYKVGLSSVYKIGDRLLAYKDELEKHLIERENKLHPGREMLYLFDLTNFYFDGQALGNGIAKHGKSKEKRNDCPLVSLGLIVDSSGFPVSSKIFPGNIGEPSTLSAVLDNMGYFDDFLPEMKPTLVMDRGIATKDNINLLKDKKLPYILITRGPRNKHYLTEFENHNSDSEFKSIELSENTDKAGQVSELKFREKPVFDINKNQADPLLGSYVIETVHKEKTAEEIWNLYMTLTRVEDAFRCMKSDLGTRPIYHQIERRTKGHLFISVLAYHLLINIEYKLSKAGDKRRWAAIRNVLKTHQRSTVIIPDSSQNIHHVRLNGTPEPAHSQIYQALKIKPPKQAKKYIIAKRL